MTTYTTINPSSLAYQTKTLAGVVNSQTLVDSQSGNNQLNELATGGNGGGSFVQSVLQSLQNLGVNTADIYTNGASTVDSSTSANINDVLQTFVKDLYNALTQGSNQPASSVDNNGNGSGVQPSVDNTSTLTNFSGGTNFKYTVDLSDAQLGDNLANVGADIKTALDNIGQYISSNVVFNLKVLTESVDSSTLAETSSTLITTSINKNVVSSDTSFVSDSIQGSELNPNLPDATLSINLAKIDQMSFNGSPSPDKYDLTTILTHEILHGLAFTGVNSNANPTLKTAYDQLIATQNSAPVFVGRHAETVNSGNPVPLSPTSSGALSAYYHVAIANDLMSESIAKGEVKSISALDVAMLEDMGIAVTGASPMSSKLQNRYNNPSANLQNLMNSISSNSTLEANFTNLVQSLGGTASSSSAKLQDFLTQLATNTQNDTSLQNGSGSLFSAAA